MSRLGRSWVQSNERLVAEQAVAEATALARSRYRTTLDLATKGDSGDIVTDVDLECEAKIVKLIHDKFPQHRIIVEETSGHDVKSRWTWLVDPLDGTNNYAHGIPLYGAAVTLCEDGRPVLACISEGSSGTLITAVSGGGVFVDGEPVGQQRFRTIPRVSSALWTGYDVDRVADHTVSGIASSLLAASRRVFETWAPTADVALYLRGAIDVIVGYNCAGTELLAALLVLQEAGAAIVGLDFAGLRLRRIPAIFVVGVPDVAAEIAELISLPGTLKVG